MAQYAEWLKKWRSKLTVASLTIVVLALAVGVGLLLSNTYGASQVAANAQELHWTNSTKGAAGIARAAVAQAVFFSFHSSAGSDSAAAIDEALLNLAIVAAADTSAYSSGEIAEALNAFLNAGGETIELASGGSPDQAEHHRRENFEESYRGLYNLLTERQNVAANLIAASEKSAGQISRLTFVAVTFFIPAIAMLALWILLRRKMGVREAEMNARVEAERELNRAKDDLIAGLSHELRTPLTSIFGFSEILLDDVTVQGEAHELMTLINASSADLSRMVNDLLTAARLDADALTTNLGEVDLASEVSTVAEPYLRSGEKLHVSVPAISVYTDSLHLRQIVHNLVSNAVRHGGDEIVITASLRGNKAVLVVADSGNGVPDYMADRLFKRFAHRGHRAVVEGSVGLGLAISHELAMKLSGSLQYRRVDGWTTFGLSLPVMVKRVDLDRETVEFATTSGIS